MKKLMKYLFLLFLGAFVFHSCSKDDISSQRLAPADFFVTFETKSGEFSSISMTEGDTVVVTVTIAATRGNPVTVDFNVTPPTVVNPLTAAFEILDMNNNPMSPYRLTFPQGTGAQSFKFVATDNDIVDGGRSFLLTLAGNSAGYKLGVGGSDEGRTMIISVKDDEVVLTMKELCGIWNVKEDIYYMLTGTPTWTDGHEYTIKIDSIGTTSSVRITGIGDDEDVVVTGTVSLDTKVKTITIAAQNVEPSLEPPYTCRFCFLGSTTFINNINTGVTSVIAKANDGALTIRIANSPGLYGSYTWLLMALAPGTNAFAGYWGYAYGTVWTKEPSE